MTGNDGDFVQNDVSIYTDRGTDDEVEQEFDEDIFDDNVDDVTIMIQHCMTD